MTQRVKLADLQEFKAISCLLILDEDALKYYQPRLAQLPFELAELSKILQSNVMKEYKKDKEIKDLKKKLNSIKMVRAIILQISEVKS